MDTSSHPNSPPASPAGEAWRGTRRLLLAVGTLVTLLAIFYTVENWRGKRAWDNCRRQLEAKGEVLDWAAFLPAPVPDEQNFYKAPHMQEWFVKQSFGSATLPGTPKPFEPAPRRSSDLVLAEVKVMTPGLPDDTKADAILRLDEPAAREQAAALLGQAVGPCFIGPRSCVLTAKPVEQIRPLHLVLQAQSTPSLKTLAAFFPASPWTNSGSATPPISYLRVDAADSNSFRVSIKGPVYGAADYLAWTDPLGPDFEFLRQALERPLARIDCNYDQPYAIAIPNFVMVRSVTQLLCQRAQSYLLLGQPEAAWQELELVHALCHILEAKPVTLVAAMIRVAVEGMDTSIVADGLRLHAWREPQLVALEQQLQGTDLLAPVTTAFKAERAATCRTLTTLPRGELAKLFKQSNPFAQRLTLLLMPQGWFYQNMALGSKLNSGWTDSVDLTNRIVRAHLISKTNDELTRELAHTTPYNVLVAIALPNFVRAMQTTAHHQTLLDEAAVACGLERYRLSQGSYPESLGALVPRYATSLPHDLIGGQLLKYNRSGPNRYRLYSIGWNEKDDGGLAGTSLGDGDWVWEVN